MIVPESLCFRLFLIVGVVIGKGGLFGACLGIHLSITCDGRACARSFFFVRSAVRRCPRGRYRLVSKKRVDRTMGKERGGGEEGRTDLLLHLIIDCTSLSRRSKGIRMGEGEE